MASAVGYPGKDEAPIVKQRFILVTHLCTYTPRIVWGDYAYIWHLLLLFVPQLAFSAREHCQQVITQTYSSPHYS